MEVDRSQEYMEALEEELNKITLFQRELPLSLQLVTQAIELCKRQRTTEIMGVGSESEETSYEGGPLLEEFMPIRRDSNDTQEQDHREDDKSDGSHDRSNKPDWLRSVQLWNQDVETAPPIQAVDSRRKSLSLEAEKRDVASTPSCKEKRAPSVAVADHAASAATKTWNRGGDKEEQLQRKARRCWSPELHRQFLHALQQLGGSHVATPKHIRELMKVDGLTNDEIKSHLQKYRLHTRQAPNPSTRIGKSQPEQLLVVGEIWVTPQYAAAATSVHAPEVSAAKICIPLATTVTTPSVASAEQPPARAPMPKKKPRQSVVGPLPSDRNGSEKLQRLSEHLSFSDTSSSRSIRYPAL